MFCSALGSFVPSWGDWGSGLRISFRGDFLGFLGGFDSANLLFYVVFACICLRRGGPWAEDMDPGAYVKLVFGWRIGTARVGFGGGKTGFI